MHGLRVGAANPDPDRSGVTGKIQETREVLQFNVMAEKAGSEQCRSSNTFLNVAGPSRLLREVVQSENVDDSHNEEVEVVEETPIGHVVQSENGEYYMVVEDEHGNNTIERCDGNMLQNNMDMDISQMRDHEECADGEEEIEIVHEHETLSLIVEPVPQGLKARKNRQYGTSRCPECGASFINDARLERHLAVHQVFGSYLCPLCGKTYKYEYNLFYHWRKTCRDLNELIPSEERRCMDVNELRNLVDEVATKKSEIGPIDIGISRSLLFQTGPLARLEMPPNPLGRRGTACRGCGVVVSSSHMPRHLAIHRGEVPPGQRSMTGGFFCDLCGLVFRQHFNLIKHWRTSCPEIQANLPDDVELTLDDNQLRDMVADLLKRSVTVELDNLPGPKRMDYNVQMDSVIAQRMSASGSKVDDVLDEDSNVIVDGSTFGDEGDNQAQSSWTHDQAVVFADDFGDEDEIMEATTTTGEEGSASVAAAVAANKAKWRMGAPGAGVQCPECFRSFANTGRLERHLAGFHASFGSHHCVLCGNRFKYDYNLLYHYRKSCPYTKNFIDRDVREQMDAASLRKLVRQLAQKQVRLTPQIKTETMEAMRAFNLRKGASVNDARIRKEMNKLDGGPPPQLLQPRAGLSDAQPCPVCGIIFYGQSAVNLHVQAVHQPQQQQLQEEIIIDTDGNHRYVRRGDSELIEYIDDNQVIEEEDEGPIEPPPTLERQEPTEPPPIPPTTSASEDDPQSRLRYVDLHGEEIVSLNGPDMDNVQKMIECGELVVGDHIVVVDESQGVDVGYQVADIHLTVEPPLRRTVVLVQAEIDLEVVQDDGKKPSESHEVESTIRHDDIEEDEFGGALLETMETIEYGHQLEQGEQGPSNDIHPDRRRGDHVETD